MCSNSARLVRDQCHFRDRLGEMRSLSLTRHLNVMDERNIDVQCLSPRPVAMMHWESARLVDRWTTYTNDVIKRSCDMYPDRWYGVAQLPQNSKIPTSNCVYELERCIKELGFVGALVNPDPGGDR